MTRIHLVIAVVATVASTSCAVNTNPKRVGFPWPMLARSSTPFPHAEVETLGPPQAQSTVLIRSVGRPTRANLDYAAYYLNPMLTTKPEMDLSMLAGEPPRERPPFGGVIVPSSMVGSLAETPLRQEAQARAMAFSPLVDYLSRWNPGAASSLEDARIAVMSESWGQPKSIQTTYQQITTVYLHMAGPSEPDPGWQWWVKVEFHPWATLFWDMPDSDKNGVPEMYGRLRRGIASPEVESRVKEDYMSRELTAEEVRRWLNELASYWYPSYNTDVAIAGQRTVFPSEETEPEIAKRMEGTQVTGAVFALRGKPDGKLIYNVFVVDGVSIVDLPKSPAMANSDSSSFEVTSQTSELLELLRAECREHGGPNYEAWAEKLEPLHKRIRRLLAKRSEKRKGFVGKDGWLFFRSSLRYVVGGDLRAQSQGKSPFEPIVSFKNTLAFLGVDFLLVPVPSKVEVYPEKLVDVKPGPGGEPPIMNPYGRKLLLELAEAGVESVDLLPLFLAARTEERADTQALYLTQDTHWSPQGLGLAARAVAARVRQYPWFESLGEERVYTRREVAFDEPGDLVSRLAPSEARKLRPMHVVADQVVEKDETIYDDDPGSPIVVLGDSFTGVFQRTFTSGAGVSAHLAAELGHPVDLVMSYGGGPNVRRALLRRGLEDLSRRRLVIWMFAARDLYDYFEDWEVINVD